MRSFHPEWKHRWVTPKAGVKKSKIHGVGIFAVKPIKKGEIVGMLGGIIIPRNRIDQYRKKMGGVGIQIDDNFFIMPLAKPARDSAANAALKCAAKRSNQQIGSFLKFERDTRSISPII